MVELCIDELIGCEIMGYDFDGIEELNNLMLCWWLISFYLLIIWGIGYIIVYFVWLMIFGVMKGLFGYLMCGEVVVDIIVYEVVNVELVMVLFV